MKKLFTFAFVMAMGALMIVHAEDAPVAPTDGSKIGFSKTEYDFGTIKSGSPVSHEFEFKNDGTAPLVLTNVKASCGCTTPSWPKEPIAPGETGKISATYNNAGAGNFNKSVTVTTQGGETVVLYLKGVSEAPAGDTPVMPTITPIQKP